MPEPTESDIREMLQRRADCFAVASAPSAALLHRASRRRARNVISTAGATLTLAATAVASISSPSEPGSTQRAQPTAPPKTAQLRLIDYTTRGRPHPRSGTGPVITLEDVRKHQRCMRSQGFDLPAPKEQADGSWSVILDEAQARELSFRSENFREAWFVTCGPLGGPLSGDLVVGGPRAKIDRFIDCMSREGFAMPEPTNDASGAFDIDEWQFDLDATNIDTSTRAWNRAMFVTCAPDRI
jgi:hypothetical protein